MVHAYWLIGREIVEFEQHGAERAGYGEELMKRVATRLSAKFGKGFSLASLKRMKQFYLVFPGGSALVEAGATAIAAYRPRCSRNTASRTVKGASRFKRRERVSAVTLPSPRSISTGPRIPPERTDESLAEQYLRDRRGNSEERRCSEAEGCASGLEAIGARWRSVTPPPSPASRRSSRGERGRRTVDTERARRTC